MTARTRIVGWMVLLVGVALAVSVFATQTVLTARLDDRVDRELRQEARKLDAYARSAVDPSTGKPFTDIAALLDRYLTRNLPDRDETLFTVVDGKAASRSPGHRPPVRLDTDRDFVAKVGGTSEPTSAELDSAAGEIRYAILPIRLTTDARQAQLVVEEFRDQIKQREVDGPITVLAIVGLIALLLAGLASWLVAGRVLAPVRLVRRAAEEISETDLHRRISIGQLTSPRGASTFNSPSPTAMDERQDDVAALARTFNAMLDRLELAFTTQREFLNDVGHELRTPITVVRGHLELMGDSPAERTETIALVTDELDRMARIVDDLLLLARSDRPDFLSYEETSVADLAMDALAKSRVLANRDWALDAVADVEIRADPQRLTQALLQLVSNAVRYTKQGEVIAIGSAVRNDRIALWVRDSGSGVPPDVADRVFERFVRAGPRSGAGLGLAIVAAIAEAHCGHARLESVPGKGTTVTLDLPLVKPGVAPMRAEPADDVETLR